MIREMPAETDIGGTAAGGRIRVLHVLPDLVVGGAESMAVGLMRGLDPSRFEAGAVVYRSVGSRLEIELSGAGIPMWALGKRLGFDRHTPVRFDRVLRHFRPHIVHTHLNALPYALPALLWRRVPALIHTIHKMAERERGLLRYLHWTAFRLGVLPVSVARAVSGSIKRVYRVSDPLLIPNGIPVEEYRRPDERLLWRKRESFGPKDVLFVCVASLRPVKNHALLIDAFARGPAIDPRAKLVVIGDGPLRNDLIQLARSRNVDHSVHFLNERIDVPSALAASDVFVLSSDSEANPLCVMEAMAAGLPVVGTAVGGVPELVESGVHGILVPPGDADAMASAMLTMVHNSHARTSMGRAAMCKSSQEFSLNLMVKAYEKLYADILNQ